MFQCFPEPCTQDIQQYVCQGKIPTNIFKSVYPSSKTQGMLVTSTYDCYIKNPLRWRHNEHDGVSNHQPHHCLLNRLFGCRSKKTSKLRVTGLCAGNSPGTGEFPAQMASNAENVSFWWRHHARLMRGCYAYIWMSLSAIPVNNITALVQITAWHRTGDKPLAESMTVTLLTHICVTRPRWVKVRGSMPGQHNDDWFWGHLLHIRIMNEWALAPLKSPGKIWLIVQELFKQTAHKHQSYALLVPLWGESIGYRWIPLTKGQWWGKRFNATTSSWKSKSDLTYRQLPGGRRCIGCMLEICLLSDM